MLDQGVSAKLALVGWVSGVASFLFGTHTAIVLLAFFGASIALMQSEKERSYMGACFFVCASTITGAVGAAGVTFAVPGFPERLSAFLLGLVAIPLIEGITEVARTLPKRARDKWL